MEVATAAPADVPLDAPEHCPGTSSASAGAASSCAGCPNQAACASGEAAKPDPDLPLIRARLAGVRRKVLVLSGKGGVGKSSVTALLGQTLVATGAQVGLMDADICGPSLPILLGVGQEQVHQSADGWSPVFVDEGLSVMSAAFLVGSPDAAVIWRGPKKNGLIKNFVRDVDWGELDWLLVDTPPGTSDEHLSVVQFLRDAAGLDGAVLVTTPQQVALQDVRREAAFCRKVGVRILGLVENMAGFECGACGGRSQIFTSGAGVDGAADLAAELDIPLLGRLPLVPALARAADEGRNPLLDDQLKDSAVIGAVRDLLKRMQKEVGAGS